MTKYCRCGLPIEDARRVSGAQSCRACTRRPKKNRGTKRQQAARAFQEAAKKKGHIL